MIPIIQAPRVRMQMTNFLPTKSAKGLTRIKFLHCICDSPEISLQHTRVCYCWYFSSKLLLEVSLCMLTPLVQNWPNACRIPLGEACTIFQYATQISHSHSGPTYLGSSRHAQCSAATSGWQRCTAQQTSRSPHYWPRAFNMPLLSWEVSYFTFLLICTCKNFILGRGDINIWWSNHLDPSRLRWGYLVARQNEGMKDICRKYRTDFPIFASNDLWVCAGGWKWYPGYFIVRNK